MPASYTIDTTGHLVRATLSGSVRGKDIAAAVRAIFDDPKWQPGCDIVWDSTGITELLFEPTDLPELVAIQREMASRAGPGQDVIVAKRPLDYAMAKMYSAMMRQHSRPVTVCRTIAQAEVILKRSLA
jgi:hypothetical protein